MKMIALRRFPFFTVSLSELPTAMTAWLQIFSLMVTVQKGCTNSMSPAESIHLREKNIAGPTERSRKGGEAPLRKLGGQDLRFSMKMMLTPDQEISRSPTELHAVMTAWLSIFSLMTSVFSK